MTLDDKPAYPAAVRAVYVFFFLLVALTGYWAGVNRSQARDSETRQRYSALKAQYDRTEAEYAALKAQYDRIEKCAAPKRAAAN